MIDIKNIIITKNKELEEKHSYAKKTWISVSNIKDYVKIPFDREGVAKSTSEKYFNNVNSEYYQMSPEAIVEKWTAKSENSKLTGRLCDDYIELKFENKEDGELQSFKEKVLNEHLDMKNRFIGMDGCLDDFKRNKFNFECREMKLMLPFTYRRKVYMINGRLDALFSFISNQEKLVIIDWKNSEEIKSKGFKGKKLLGPCDKFDDCDLCLFTIQVYLYKYILEKVYGVDVPILTYIVQFPAQKDYYYKVFEPAFEYDEKLMEKIIKFCVLERIKENKESK